MDLKVIKTTLEEIRAFRNVFLHESNFQFIYNKCHDYGWADVYLFTLEGIKAGYGAVWGANKREDRDAIFEFYLTPPFRKFSNIVFREFYSVSHATLIECQSNDLLLTSMLYESANNIQAEAILFEDHDQTQFNIKGVIFYKQKQEQSSTRDIGGFVLEQNGEVVASGGFMLNYNIPYADIYMEVKEGERQKGYGSLIIQELKKEIYMMGRIPAARCNINNQASKATLLKSGFIVCGLILKGNLGR
ncbi:MAG: GCN5-related N-acetyltransferase [Mucilaginibacter sp.]|nr:GCN5-related N-acetyltransferase [Mucilaginibacter sp.]